MNINNYIGRKYGCKKIIKYIKTKKFVCNQKTYVFLTQCDCGHLRKQNLCSLQSRKPKYCLKCAPKSHEGKGGPITHGLTKTSIYKSWLKMRQRCDNPNSTSYHRYGGRGIKYDKSWASSITFIQDMLSTWKPGLTLERVNNDKNYSKENCRWATRYEQAQNRNNTIKITYENRTQTLSQWGKEIKVSVRTLYSRYKNKWPIEKVLSKKWRPCYTSDVLTE